MSKLSADKLKKYEDAPIKDLETLNNRDLSSILMEIYERRSKGLNCYDILDRYQAQYAFFGPSKADLRTVTKYNSLFLSCLPANYDAIELSPINPFGTNASITSLSQKNILTSIKNSEVCSDATTALTLEACKRRKALVKNPSCLNLEVNLATIKKVLRMQRFEEGKGYLQHFGQFAILSSGRKENNFELNKLKEHIKLWVEVLLRMKEEGFSLGELNVGIGNIHIIEHLIENDYASREVINRNSFTSFKLFEELGINLPDKVNEYSDFNKTQIENYKLYLIRKYIDNLSSIIAELMIKYPKVNFYIEMDRKGGLGYYVDSCFHIYSKEGENYVPLCDGGIPSWNSKILRDNKETSICSGIGSELILNLYGKGFNK